MPFPLPTGRRALTALTAGALVAALPATAQAAPAGRHKPIARPFSAHGLVIGHTSSHLTLLATAVRTAKSTARNTTVTVGLPSRRTGAGKALAKRLARLHDGDRLSVNGITAAGTYTAKNFTATAAPYHAYLGTVTAVRGTTVQVAKAGEPSDDANEPSRGAFTVDVSAAAVTVDGTPGTLAIGQTVAILGSSVHDVVAATAVFAFTAAPGVVTGRITATAGAVVTLGDAEGDDHGDGQGDDHGDDQSDDPGGDDAGPASSGIAVDLSAATLIVDGTSGATPATLASGSRLLALGTDNGDGTFTATLAFGFTHACSSRHHGDGGQDSGDGD
jgi:hypothetical protein